VSGETFIQAGDFALRMSLEAEAHVPDGYGGMDSQWVHEADCWTRIVPVLGILTVRAGQAVSEITHFIYLRRMDGVEHGKRFRKGLRAFLILNAYDPDETGRYIKCETRELA
jgi:SPP1 family predicted phage head-tail adaptor